MPGTSSDKVFISYRQTHDEQRQRVREFALKLQGCGIEVILDQMYLEAHPADMLLAFLNFTGRWDEWLSLRFQVGLQYEYRAVEMHTRLGSRSLDRAKEVLREYKEEDTESGSELKLKGGLLL